MEDNDTQADSVLLVLEIIRQDATGADVPKGMTAHAAGVSQSLNLTGTGDCELVLRVLAQVRKTVEQYARKVALAQVISGILDEVTGDDDAADAALDAFDPQQWSPAMAADGQLTATHEPCGQTFGVVEAFLGGHVATCPKLAKA